MSFEADLFAVLKDVCPRAYPDIAPSGAIRPYITYQLYGGRVINPLSNAAPGKRNAFVQINVWASTRLEANNMSRQAEDAIRGAATFTGQPQTALASDYEPDVPICGARQDFSCWY